MSNHYALGVFVLFISCGLIAGEPFVPLHTELTEVGVQCNLSYYYFTYNGNFPSGTSLTDYETSVNALPVLGTDLGCTTIEENIECDQGNSSVQTYQRLSVVCLCGNELQLNNLNNCSLLTTTSTTTTTVPTTVTTTTTVPVTTTTTQEPTTTTTTTKSTSTTQAPTTTTTDQNVEPLTRQTITSLYKVTENRGLTTGQAFVSVYQGIEEDTDIIVTIDGSTFTEKLNLSNVDAEGVSRSLGSFRVRIISDFQLELSASEVDTSFQVSIRSEILESDYAYTVENCSAVGLGYVCPNSFALGTSIECFCGLDVSLIVTCGEGLTVSTTVCSKYVNPDFNAVDNFVKDNPQTSSAILLATGSAAVAEVPALKGIQAIRGGGSVFRASV